MSTIIIPPPRNQIPWKCTLPALCWTCSCLGQSEAPAQDVLFCLISAASDPGKLGSSDGQMSSVQGSSTLQRQFLCLATVEVLLSSSLLLLTIHLGPLACPPNTGWSPGSSQDNLFCFNHTQTLFSYNELHHPSPSLVLRSWLSAWFPTSLLLHFCIPACSQGHCFAMHTSHISRCLRTPQGTHWCALRGFRQGCVPPLPRYTWSQTCWTFTIRIVAGPSSQAPCWSTSFSRISPPCFLVPASAKQPNTKQIDMFAFQGGSWPPTQL